MMVGVSSRGELAYQRPEGGQLTLARVPLAGGAPRDVLAGVSVADWTADGNDFAVIRFVNGRRRLEFPIGQDKGEVESSSALRVSPDGQRVALLQHPVTGDDGGHVTVVEKTGERRRVSTHYASLGGLAWSRDGREIWFGGARSGSLLGLQAVTLDGRERTLLQTGSRMIVHDVDAAGRVLLDAGTTRIGVRYGDAQGKECELSWLDSTSAIQMTRDGSRVLLVESGDGGGPDYGIYLRPSDASPPVRLGSGRATSISPDGSLVLAIPIQGSGHIELIPTGAGQRRILKHDGFARYDFAGFLGDSGRILFVAMKAGESKWYAYVQALDGGGAPRPVGQFTTKRAIASVDGKKLVKWCPSGQCLLDLETLQEQPLRGWPETTRSTGMPTASTCSCGTRARCPRRSAGSTSSQDRRRPGASSSRRTPSACARWATSSVRRTGRRTPTATTVVCPSCSWSKACARTRTRRARLRAPPPARPRPDNAGRDPCAGSASPRAGAPAARRG
jgi:hypothetical protein